ncbi:MAG: VOC family protein, partial [Porticoccaceae bacterium]
GQYKRELDDRAPRLSGITRVVVAVEDIEHAVKVYGGQFKLPIESIVEDTERGVHSAICRPPTGGAIELVAVKDASRTFASAIERHLQEKREGMYALVLKSLDLQATAKSLAGHGIKVSPAEDNSNVLEVPREDAFGALIRIEAA